MESTEPFAFSDDDFHSVPAPDAVVEEAKEALARFFKENPESTFYEGQLKVLFEDVYFHWVTTRALRQLVAMGVLATDLLQEDPFPIRFYRAPRHRYWRRQASEIAKLVHHSLTPRLRRPSVSTAR